MKVNKLIGLENTLKELKLGVPTSTFIHRITGRSTAIALNIISLAIQHQSEWVLIWDHNPTQEANRMLLDDIRRLISKMELKHFEFKKYPPRIRLNLFEEWEEVKEWRKVK